MALNPSNLTTGVDTSEPATSASITVPADGVAYVAVAVSETANITGAPTLTVTGLALTWTPIATVQPYAFRRSLFVYRAINTGSSQNGTLSLNYNADGGTFQEMLWSVDLYTGADTADPDDAPVTGSVTTGTTLTLGDVGAPDAGDSIYCAFGFEDGADSFALEGSFTELGSETGAGNVRSLKTGHDTTAALDETPSASWSTSGNGCGSVGLIVNAAGGGDPSGTATSGLPSLNQAATGTMQPAGTAASTLPAATQAASGLEVFTGTAAAVVLVVPGSGQSVLATVKQTAAGTVMVLASGAGVSVLAALTQSGSVVTIAQGPAKALILISDRAATGIEVYDLAATLIDVYDG